MTIWRYLVTGLCLLGLGFGSLVLAIRLVTLDLT